MNSDTLAATFLVISQSAVLYTVMCPDMSEVREARPGVHKVTQANLHTGIAVAGSLVIATGIMGAILAKDPVPFWVSVIAALALSTAYECVYRTPPERLAG